MHIQEERSSGKRKLERSSIEGEETNPSNKRVNERSMMSPTKVSLNGDMLTEVLSYLPFDAVTRFKSVSKSWLQLISDPYFESLRTQRSTAAVLGFFQQATHGTGRTIRASLYRRIDDSRRRNLQRLLDGHYHILAACNGLLFVNSFDYSSYFVWNLHTESLKCIPPPPDAYGLPEFGVAAAASCSDSYDIVAMDHFCVAADNNLAPSGFVYSSRTCVWTQFGTNNDIPIDMNISLSLNLVGPACARRTLYWLTDNVDRTICAFDLGKQRLKWLSLPNQAKIRSFGGCYLNVWLGSVGNDLYVVLVSAGNDIELWILEDYEECRWRKVLEVKGSDNSKGGAPVCFDGRRIAIAVIPGEWLGGASMRCIDFYDTHNKMWEKPSFLPTYTVPARYFLPLVEDKF